MRTARTHVVEPDSALAKARSLREILFGRPLRSDEENEEKVGPVRGVAVLGLDALASASYGPEAALTVLLPLGLLAVHHIIPIIGVIIVLLLAVYFSYRQTIAAYPTGGGSFTVASQNLGRHAGVFAASALGLDYILNVAVAIAAGVGAVVSAVPALLPFTLPLCLAVLALLTIVNLRGIRQAGILLTSPTWLFVGSLGLTIVVGVIKAIAAGGHPEPLVPPASPAPAVMTTTSLWLLVRAFANGTTAMTGVEAVSNAVPIFREPMVKNAQRTLTLIIAILVASLAGIAYLGQAYGITATQPGQPGYQSVLSQLYGAVVGRGGFYYFAMTALLSVLCLSANTSFADFPRLCRLLALDEYLPPSFAHRGARLVFTHGILLLAVLSAVLLIVFEGITDRLIPLFAIGALSAFTMSQWGMVAHWRRTPAPHARHSMLINAIGATATSLTVIIVLVSKFTEGAWITVVVIGAFMALLLSTRRHIEQEEARVGAEVANCAPLELELDDLRPPIILVWLRRLDRVSRKALRLAIAMSDDIEAVEVLTDDPTTSDLRSVWRDLVEEPVRRRGRTPPKLTTIPSEYREFFTPFLAHVQAVVAANPGRHIAVVVPDLVRRRWYHSVLRLETRASLLKTLLRHRGGPQVVIIETPWHLCD